MLKEIVKKLDEFFNREVLFKIIAVLIILFLLMKTTAVWGSWIDMLKSILMPFMAGFGMAYVIYPLILWVEKRGVPRNLAIIVFWILLIIMLVLLSIYLMPILYEKLADFTSSMISGIKWITAKVSGYGSSDDNFMFVNDLSNTLITMLQSYKDWLPDIVSSIPGFMNTFLNVVTNSLFSIIIAIYMLFDFERMKGYIVKFFEFFFQDSRKFLHQIDEDVSVYLKSMFILMLIRFVEYSLFYFLVGHQDWLVVGLLSAIGIWIPYIGGIIANIIAILTALSLSPLQLTIVIVGTCVLSNVDSYIISPIIHERRSSLGPLLTLFAVFAGGVIYGAIGIMLSVPIAIAVKSIYQVYSEDHKGLKEDKEVV